MENPPLHIPNIHDLAELFDDIKEYSPSCSTRIKTITGGGKVIYPSLTMRAADGSYHCFHITPRPAVIGVVADMLSIDNDQISFGLFVHEKTSLVTASYSKIIGSRWLSHVDNATLPVLMKEAA